MAARALTNQRTEKKEVEIALGATVTLRAAIWLKCQFNGSIKIYSYLDASQYNARSDGADACQKERYGDLQQYGGPLLLLDARSIECQLLLGAAIDARNAGCVSCQGTRTDAAATAAATTTTAASSASTAAAARRTWIRFGRCYGRRDD